MKNICFLLKNTKFNSVISKFSKQVQHKSVAQDCL